VGWSIEHVEVVMGNSCCSFLVQAHVVAVCHLEIEANLDTAYIETLKTLKLSLIE
jgi:hypothetical protein